MSNRGISRRGRPTSSHPVSEPPCGTSETQKPSVSVRGGVSQRGATSRRGGLSQRGGANAGSHHASSSSIPGSMPSQQPESGESSGSLLPTMTPAGGFMPERNGFVTLGRPINLTVNMFSIKFPDAIWHRYDVSISYSKTQDEQSNAEKGRNRIQSRKLNKLVICSLYAQHQAQMNHKLPAYDGRKTLIMTEKLFDRHIFEVRFHPPNGREIMVIVEMQYVGGINMGSALRYYDKKTKFLDPEVLVAANIVMDSSLGINYVAVGRSYYDPQHSGLSLQGGKEVRTGFYTSAVFAQWEPLLIIDKSSTAFFEKKHMVDYMAEVLNDKRRNFIQTGLSPMDINKLSKDLKHVVVKLLHTSYGRSVRIDKLSALPANKIFFNLENGASNSVAEYFKNTYPTYGLKHPQLPCIEVKKSNGTRTEYFPVEVCEIKENQPYRKKLNPVQTSNMIKGAQATPDQRMTYAQESLKSLKLVSGTVLSQFGVEILDDLVRTQGRVLPDLMVKVKNRTIPTREGAWRIDEYHLGAELNNWVVVDHSDCNKAQDIAHLLYQKARGKKFQNLRPFLDVVNVPPGSSSVELLRRVSAYRKSQDPLLAVIILGQNSNYGEIKHLTEVSEFQGIIVQCLRSERLPREGKNPNSYIDNVLLKINAKLGGINTSMDPPASIKDKPYIVIGADVSHPGVGDMNTPSIAAVVGSLDYTPTRYHTEIRVQVSEKNNRVEHIKDFEAVAKTLLIKNYLSNMKTKPQHIIYLRDGVSDGQFETVRVREIQAIRNACQSLESDYKPRVTVIVAQKRHHTRFNVVDKRDAVGRSGNIPPGTVVDKDVIHPQNHDLYLCSQKGLIGTSRPTKYQVIHDDSPRLSANEISELIYYFCHLFARTTSTVSLPAPVFYAHLAAARAKDHIKGDPTVGFSDLSTISSEDMMIDLSKYQRACEIHKSDKDRPYFI